MLELGRLKLPDMFDLLSTRPELLVERERVFGVRERILSDGSVGTPLDNASVAEAARKAIASGAEGIVIAFLHS